MPDETRVASRPAAGAGRDAIRTALGVIVAGLVTQVLPGGTTVEMKAAAAALALAVVSAGLAALGKFLRSKGIEGLPF